jgi:type II secretory pathway pseudopilin PulG
MIEMLVVFIVFGVSAMIAIRSVGDTLRRDRVAKAAAIMSTDLEQAFALAARQRIPVRLRMVDSVQLFTVRDRTDTTVRFRRRSYGSASEFGLDYMKSSRDSFDIMPNGLASDTINITIGVKSTGGTRYTKSIRATRGGLVRVGNR